MVPRGWLDAKVIVYVPVFVMAADPLVALCPKLVKVPPEEQRHEK